MLEPEKLKYVLERTEEDEEDKVRSAVLRPPSEVESYDEYLRFS